VSRSDTLLLLDFDGTVAVGHGPVHAYARAAAASLAPAAADAFRVEAAAAIEAAGEWGDGPAASGARAPLDGYDLVRVLAEKHGVGPLALSAAYLASRHALGTDQAPVRAPAGLAAVLAELRTEATVVLATNAPDIRLTPTLAALGLSGLLDVVLTEVGKPAGMTDALDRLGVAGPDGPVRVLSVGDVWANDLAPVAARGHATALISRRPPPEARPTWTVPELPELYPALRNWVRGGGRTDPLHLPHATDTARFPARVTSEG
jgi:FMN phosphatase YigB (HAD superfamily)